jgi:hypothetical protein
LSRPRWFLRNLQTCLIFHPNTFNNMTNGNQKLQTVTGQLFESKGEVILWLGILLVLITGLIGTFWDLSDANILGTGQSLDSGSAGLMVIAALVVGAFFLGNVVLGSENRRKRGLEPLVSEMTGKLVFFGFLALMLVGVICFLAAN